MIDLEALLGEATAILDRLGCRWALIGGLALGAHGIARLTADVDLAVEGERQNEIVAAFEAAGFDTLHRSAGYSNHLRDEDRIDLVYVRSNTRRQLFGSAETLEGPGGREVPVVRAEHLAAMKVLAMKNDPDRQLQELADLRQILRLPGVDREEIRGYMERHGFENFYQRLVEGT